MQNIFSQNGDLWALLWLFLRQVSLYWNRSISTKLNICQQSKAYNMQMLLLKIQADSLLCRKWTKVLLISELMQNSWYPHETALMLMASQSSRALGFFLVLFFFFPRPEMNELLFAQTHAFVGRGLCIWNFLLWMAISLSKVRKYLNLYTYTHPYPHL